MSITAAGELWTVDAGEADWAQKSYEITGSGTHSLLWQYTKDDSSSDGDDSA